MQMIPAVCKLFLIFTKTEEAQDSIASFQFVSFLFCAKTYLNSIWGFSNLSSKNLSRCSYFLSHCPSFARNNVCKNANREFLLMSNKTRFYYLWQLWKIVNLSFRLRVGTRVKRRESGSGTDLCTAVYQPAARVRLMTTSTGIRSATASLLALMVRKIPFPAWIQTNSISVRTPNLLCVLKLQI